MQHNPIVAAFSHTFIDFTKMESLLTQHLHVAWSCCVSRPVAVTAETHFESRLAALCSVPSWLITSFHLKINFPFSITTSPTSRLSGSAVLDWHLLCQVCVICFCITNKIRYCSVSKPTWWHVDLINLSVYLKGIQFTVTVSDHLNDFDKYSKNLLTWLTG